MMRLLGSTFQDSVNVFCISKNQQKEDEIAFTRQRRQIWLRIALFICFLKSRAAPHFPYATRLQPP
jgi:hypothetical protein